jgi:hypothetical protein
MRRGVTVTNDFESGMVTGITHSDIRFSDIDHVDPPVEIDAPGFSKDGCYQVEITLKDQVGLTAYYFAT